MGVTQVRVQSERASCQDLGRRGGGLQRPDDSERAERNLDVGQRGMGLCEERIQSDRLLQAVAGSAEPVVRHFARMMAAEEVGLVRIRSGGLCLGEAQVVRRASA